MQFFIVGIIDMIVFLKNKIVYKKTTLFLALVAMLFSCKKEPVQPAEVPVTKTVQFRIAQASDYSGPVHDGLKAEVRLSSAKESILDGRILSSWDTTFSLRSIRDFAPATNPFSVTKQVGGYFAKQGTYSSVACSKICECC